MFVIITSLLCLVILISVLGFYMFLKRQKSSAAISKRVCVMDIPGVTTPELEIRIPIEWRHKKIEGPGFYTHSFGSPDGDGNVTVYIGHNPSIKEEATSRKSVKRVGGKKIEFFTAVTDQTVMSQAIVKGFFDELDNNAISTFALHIMVVEREKGFANRAFQALDTLKILK